MSKEISYQIEQLLLAISSLDTGIDFYCATIPKLEKIHREIRESQADQRRILAADHAFYGLQSQLEWMEKRRSDYLDELVELAKKAGSESSLTGT
ncbi:hypothetical protein [Larkinella terrae]|uniref:Uncharacterized protein n=1 Tax=Larkinella terrae TaxID=2025311 RepID=A0A7K0ED15_9BACT|nr:hypothetical protein [Larkinella terrae]MRS59695.1 hypothetical protein [Larkinella terrae]